MPDSHQAPAPVTSPNSLTARADSATSVRGEEGSISMIGLATVVLRWRFWILAFGVAGFVLGALSGLTSTRMYTSGAMFVPQGAESGPSGLALAAGQLGIRVPSSGGGWGPPLYVQIIRSPVILEPIALDTVVVAERGGARVALIDLLEIREATPALTLDAAVRALGGIVSAAEIRALGAVRVSVSTPWPSVSHAIAEKVVERVQAFNVEKRKSQAAAERVFVEQQAREAEGALRGAEERLRVFLERNRDFGSPELMLERERLQREVTLRQQLYTSLMQSREEARIREVRDTPVITLLEEPQRPVVGESRRTAQKAVIGGVAGALLGVFLALMSHWLKVARRVSGQEAQEFFQVLESLTPRFLQRRSR